MPTFGREAVAKFGPAFILTLFALTLWGFGHRLYATLLPDLAAAVQLSPAMSDVARAAVMIGYFVMALPSAFISRAFGSKVGALLGLGLFAIGMFLFRPAVAQQSFFLILLAATVFGSGLAVIQITSVPLILALGPRASAIQRMTFAQGFTPLGTLVGVYIGEQILTDVLHNSAQTIGHNLMLPLSALGVLAIAMAFALELAPFPVATITRSHYQEKTWASFLPPLQNTRFRFAVLAQLFSLSAQVVAASYAMGYAKAAVPSWTEAVAHDWYVLAILLMAVGRFVGAGLMWRFDPMVLVVYSCAASAICALVASFAPGMVGIWALIVMSFFLSIQIPVFLAHGLMDLEDRAKSGVAIMMFVAFSGAGLIGLGALLTVALPVHAVMLLPALCLAAATRCAIAMRKAEAVEQARVTGANCGPLTRTVCQHCAWWASACRGLAEHPTGAVAEGCVGARRALGVAADNCQG